MARGFVLITIGVLGCAFVFAYPGDQIIASGIFGALIGVGLSLIL